MRLGKNHVSASNPGRARQTLLACNGKIGLYRSAGKTGGAAMTSNYQPLNLAQVQPGMVLSDELLDVQGHVLLPQGTVLTEAMLALMPRHGISVLPILQQQVSPEAAQA